MITIDLSGKTAVVTGSCRGIGQAIAVELAKAGASIIGVDLGPLEDTEKMVKDIGSSFNGINADLIKCDDYTKIIDTAADLSGSIDILVNNAGIIRREDSLKFSEKDWDDVININLKAVFFLSQAAANHYVEKQKTGKIINIASMLSFQGGIRVPSYTASKSGVAGLTRLMANEWARLGINVNAIAPGYIATDNTAALRADKIRSAEILSRIPAERWGTPKDIAGTAVFLSSDLSHYINGYIVAVDGGWLAR